MASKRRLRKTKCGDKKRYESLAEAKQTAWHVNRKKPTQNSHLTAYHCPFCDHFHFGHAPRR
jgi:hypothetical protein